MAEVFGVAAGVLTVIDLSVKVISKCKHLIETTKDAPKDLRQIFIEISSLKATLESLRFLSDTDSDFSGTLQSLNEVEGAVRGCHNAVDELAKELDGLSISQSSQAAQGKRQMLKGSLKWCLKESRAQKLLDDAIRHKSTISLALIGEVAQDVKVIKSSVGRMKQDLDDTKRRAICNWIERINPTGNHNTALKLRDDQTCRWILRQQEWDDWVNGAHRLIWVHGIPGAGKTILASYIIEQATSVLSNRQVTSSCLYFYCSYRHGGDQTTSFLRWVVSQLCRQLNRIPQEISELHQKNAELTVAQLTNALATLLGEIGLVYIIIDAIDECNTMSDIQAADAPGMRVEFLQLLHTLLTLPEYAKIKIIATSRNYVDIEEVLRPLSAPVSMSNPLVDEDIRTYVNTQLQTNNRFRRWPLPLLREIEDALVEGAKGMFRWAACQIYILQRKRSESDLRRCLKELPETLDDTYERILLEIPRDDWEYARKALLWICAHDELPFSTGIPTTCLVSAVFSPGPTMTSAGLYAYDFAALQEICGCLIRSSEYSTDDRSFENISLAHYTVKEYLKSERIERTATMYYSLSGASSMRQYLGEVLRTCTSLELEVLPGHFFDSLQDYCREVARFAPKYWGKILLEDDELFSLQIQYLQSPQFTVDREYIPNEYTSNFHWDPTSRPPAARKSLVLLSLLQHDLFDLCNKFLDSLDFESLLYASLEVYSWNDVDMSEIMCGNILEVIRKDISWNGFAHSSIHRRFFLLEHCQKRLDPVTCLSLQLAVHDHWSWSHSSDMTIRCPITKLLGVAGSLDPSGLALTPLQIATMRGDLSGTKKLLRYRVDPNRVGKNAGKSVPGMDQTWSQKSPLHILRNINFVRYIYANIHEEIQPREKILRARMERLLIQHGGLDFVVDETGTHISSCGIEYVLGEIGSNSEDESEDEDRDGIKV